MDEVTQQLRNKAFALLARREHSRRELAGKLQSQEATPEQVAAILDQLAEEGLQSDVRYASSLVRSLIARGQGPVRLRQALQQKGVDTEIAALALEEVDVDWYHEVCAVHRKRFGNAVAATPKERARQTRFLLYRGFDQDQVRHALDQARQEPP